MPVLIDDLPNLIAVSKDDLQIYQPLIFKIRSKEEKDAFYSFFSKVKHTVQVFDQIDSQLRELIKIKFPAEKKNNEEMEAAVNAHLNGVRKDEYGVWIYYPWSQHLIHSVDEEEFIHIRTNRNLYKITPEERTLLATKKIAIIGMSVGQSIAVTLATERVCGELRLADFDSLELSNLNRIKSGIENLGVSKVIIAAREITRLDPFLKIKCYLDGITENNVDEFLLADGKVDLLVEECDGVDIKILSRQKARENKIPVIMDTNDRGMLDIERFDLEPSRPLLHGLIEEDAAKNLQQLSPQERMTLLLSMVDEKNISSRLRESIPEIGKTITSYPQLASSVTLGAALCTDVGRRILLDQCNISGRFYIDLDMLISENALIENVQTI